MLYMKNVKFFIFLKDYKFLFFVTIFLIPNLILFSQPSLSEVENSKKSINGSGLKIPRMASLKKSLTYVRTGPGKEFPIKSEINQKGYPVEIIAEFNNWRKVKTRSNLSGWIHTQLLSSFKTGLIVSNTLLKKRPLDSSKDLAKLLPDLLIKIKKCKLTWCYVEVIKNENFFGWVKMKNIWGFTSK